jgi:hypothetical protein
VALILADSAPAIQFALFRCQRNTPPGGTTAT